MGQIGPGWFRVVLGGIFVEFGDLYNILWILVDLYVYILQISIFPAQGSYIKQNGIISTLNGPEWP